MNKTCFLHINIISTNWRELADFYIRVLNCTPILPERDLKGSWLERLTGIKDVHIEGIHLKVPGFDEMGPTIEILQYNTIDDHGKSLSNSRGFSHICFSVDCLEDTLNLLLENGGSTLGELVKENIPDIGVLHLVYARDPEGNIIELQEIIK